MAGDFGNDRSTQISVFNCTHTVAFEKKKKTGKGWISEKQEEEWKNHRWDLCGIKTWLNWVISTGRSHHPQKALREALSRKRWRRVKGYGKASRRNLRCLLHPEDEILSFKFSFIMNSVNQVSLHLSSCHGCRVGAFSCFFPCKCWVVSNHFSLRSFPTWDHPKSLYSRGSGVRTHHTNHSE